MGYYPVWLCGIGFPHPPLRKSFVCDDSRNIVYAKHNIICRKATSFSDRKRKRYLRLWRKMMFLPSVGNTTLWVGPRPTEKTISYNNLSSEDSKVFYIIKRVFAYNGLEVRIYANAYCPSFNTYQEVFTWLMPTMKVKTDRNLKRLSA
jgi:hypothetical protein